MPANKRLSRETTTVLKMINLYCQAHHPNPAGFHCPDCQTLAEYALQRIQRCPFGEGKPTCAQCPIHCYNTDKREQIRLVMRYAGPRMLFHHPILAILHLFDSLRRPHEKPNK